MIALQLVDIDYKNVIRRRQLLVLVSLSTSFLLIGNYLFKGFLWIYICLIVAQFTIIVFYFFTLNKLNYQLNGKLFIDSSVIKICRDSHEKILVLGDIKQLKIIYRSLDDLILPEIKNQINAFWIEIEMDKQLYIIDYIIETKYQLRQLIQFIKSFNNRENVKIFNLAKLAGSGKNKISSKELKKEYSELIDKKLQKLKTTSANII